MSQAKAWKPFVQNDSSVLWLALAGRDSGTRCSELIGVSDPPTALDLDLTCSFRLQQYENKRDFERLKAFKEAVKEVIGEILGDKPSAASSDTESEISEDDIL